ncbi:MAG: hypothetical protein HXL11_00355 [Candidatus Nanosynbacter sp.]|nr:hypothetical protein [Candidatus Nanosynbacter sp.]
MTEHITKRDNKRFIHQDKDDFLKFRDLVEAHQAISASAACRQEAALKLALKRLQQSEEIKTRDYILIELQKLSQGTSEPANMASKYLIKNDPGHASIDILNLKPRPYHCLRNRNINTIQDILSLDSIDWGRIRNLGKVSIQEIIQAMHDLGYADFYIPH